ncbi:UvrD-helicase domain-containing protein [Duganella sp. FT50W]|uniref:DNA 3'-5' helicase II n=1 Tax=Duganella lactea TaxID=2692173 RepID=A0A6L8MQ51_9BURK|nr:UvrD-helicase domain-containing protein [Duganella lactea]MYM83325.1 UvrD-helicase domain-containing protein [Duganella lactea]
MDWIDRALEVISLVTVSRHQEEVTEVSARERAAARRQFEQNLKSVSDAHAAALAKEVASSRGLGFEEGRAFERLDVARKEREAIEEAERLEREAAIERAKWLVSPNPLPISQHIAKFQSDVNGRLEYPPESESHQWDMILSDCPATYVIAGAGSGKSTSLVLRVLLLNLYAEIDRGQISVFTFTRASRADFIKKYRERMDEWGCPISEDEAKSVVRTFHSMVLKMARSAMHPRPVVLELLDRETEGPVQDFDVDNLLELTEKEAEAVMGEEAETGEARHTTKPE